MCERALTREAFGRPLAKLGGNIDIIANARMDIEMARLLTLKTAWMMDHVDPKEARIWISMIKTAVPNISIRIVDEGIQMFGATGVSQVYEVTKQLRGELVDQGRQVEGAKVGLVDTLGGDGIIVNLVLKRD